MTQTYHPDKDEFIKRSKQGNLVPVYREILADMETPVSAFKKIGDSEYALMREQKNGRYVAILKAEKEFEAPGKYVVACRVQDNLGGEAIKTREFQIDG